MASKVKLPADQADGLLKAMFVLARTVDHVLETRAVEAAIHEPMSASKVQVIRLIGQRGTQTSSQVARFLGVTKPAVSQIVDSMVGSKLLVRRPAKHDRREVGLELTKQGRNQFQAIRNEQRHLARAAIRLAENAKPDKWIDLLQGIAGSLARADRTFDQFCLQCGAHADGNCVLVGGDATCLFMQHAKAAPKRGRSTTKKPNNPKTKKRTTKRRSAAV